MEQSVVERESPLAAAASAMVKLHKEQFGRGPTKARAELAGPDTLLCVLSDALLPAERKLVDLGRQDEVQHTRLSFQSATESEFVNAIEQILYRKVVAFASATSPAQGMVFEIFQFEPRTETDDGEVRP